MAYFGNEPAKVAVKVGSGVITATELADDSITTADIIDDAITPNQLDDDGTGFQVGTLGVGAAVSGGHTLVVSGSTSLGGVAKISEAGSGNVLLETTQSSKYLQLKSNEGIYFSTSGANHNYIDSSNNLHTQDIHSKDIYLDQPRSNWRTIQYRDTDNSNAIQAYVSAYNTSASDGFLRLNAIESLQFRTGDTERLKLTSSEATFAGTIKSQPAEGTDATLHLDASGNGNAQVWIDAGTSTRHPELSFRHDGSNYWTVKSDPDRSNDFCLRDDQNSAAIQLRIAQSTGDATFAGNITMPDSLIHTGDTDTMVRFGTDEVHLRTGGGAGLYVRNSEVEVYRVTTKLSNANAQLWVGEGDGASDIYMSKGDTGDEVRFSKNAAGNLDILTNGGVIHLNVDGKCGIGTGSPSEQLHISTTGASTALQIHSGTASSTTGVSQIYFSSKDQYGGNTHQSYIKSTIDGSSSVSTTKMIFQNRNSSGSVVDVLTLYSPNATFKGTVNIRKDSGDGDLYLYNADASQGLRIDQNSIRTTTNNGFHIFPNDNSSKGLNIHNDGALLVMGGSSHTHSANVNPASDNTYDLGHSGTRWATVNAAGIKFDSDGEVLDSYEEGTWTGKLYSQNPARYYWASDTTANYFQPTTQTCSYVKIGHTVTLWGSMTFTGTNVSSYDNIGITHLPFSTVNRSGYVAVGSIFWSKDVPTSADVGAGTMCQLGANTNHMSCGTTGTTSANNYTGNFSLYMNTVTDATVQFKITYETAS